MSFGNQKKVDPLFNSGLAYLETMTIIIRECHARSLSSDLDGLYYALENLYICILPRLTQEDVDKLSDIKLACRTNHRNGRQDSLIRSSVGTHDKLREWFAQMHYMAHTNGLLMPDKPSELEALNV